VRPDRFPAREENMNIVDKEDLLSPLVPVLREKAEFALLFGSAAAGRLTEESDIDIGVYLREPKIIYDEYADLIFKLNEATCREIDLVIMNTCDIIIAMQILANGKLIINNNPGAFVLYKARKIGEYIDFKMDRKIIEDSLLKGRIYA
jgi:predicted nucleotidyltransferase